jgi:thiol:disulfide interchange protein
MNRRQLLGATAAAVALGTVPFARVVNAAMGHVDYTPEAYAKALASGEPVLLDFYASW